LYVKNDKHGDGTTATNSRARSLYWCKLCKGSIYSFVIKL